MDFEQLEQQLMTERRRVDVSSHDFSVRELVRMLSEGELSITPEYQRKYRWKDDVASTFIESILLGLPIPPIFVATNSGFQWEVVDGLQRLSSLLYFTSADTQTLSLVNRSSALKLNGLQKLSQLNGTSYPDLPKNIQLYFGRQPLQVISLTDKSDKSIRFDLFERLNAGSVALSPQEVRACIYRGEFNEFIEELSTSDTFQSLLKLYESNNHDGTTTEQVLKFFAYKNNSENFDGRVKIFLNSYMESATSSFDYVTERSTFEKATAFLSDACGGGPFLRSGSAITPIVQFESCLVAAARIYESGLAPKLPAHDWIQDPQLLAASRGGGNTRSRLNERISRAMSLFGAE